MIVSRFSKQLYPFNIKRLSEFLNNLNQVLLFSYSPRGTLETPEIRMLSLDLTAL